MTAPHQGGSDPSVLQQIAICTTTRGLAPLARPTLLYGRLLASAAQHLLGGGPAPRARVRLADGRLEPLPLDRWLAPADAADRAALGRRRGAGARPRLRAGPPPRRAAARGQARARRRPLPGRRAARARARRGRDPRCVFGAVPGAGRWRTILLLDGNIGIGGAPAALLRRAARAARARRRSARRDRPAGRADVPDADPDRGARTWSASGSRGRASASTAIGPLAGRAGLARRRTR